MEFQVTTLQRSLDLSKNYKPTQVGVLSIGLQTIKDDIAEIEIQGPEGVTKHAIPVAAAVTAQGYTIINRDVGLILPSGKKQRRFFFGKRDNTPVDGLMEAILDVRWGDQSMTMAAPDKDTAHDFILVRQYEVVADRPMVYHNQDSIQFGDLRLEIGERVEEDSRNYKKPRYAEFVVRFKDKEPETWQIKLDGKYSEYQGYRVRVTSYDFYNGWYQGYGISIAKGRPKDYIDETENLGAANGISTDAHVGHTDALTLSQTRLDEAEKNPNELILKVGESRNLGKVGIKLLGMRPGHLEIMLLSPRVKKTTLVHGQPFEFGRYEISLVGVHGDRAIVRVEED